MNIQKRVRNLIEKYGTNNPFKLCRKLGIEVIYSDLGNIKGYYNSVLRNKFIAINESLSDGAKEIVCAHELAHALFHSDKTTRFLLDHTKVIRTAKQEHEANEFVFCLLGDKLSYICLKEDELKHEILEEIASYRG